MFNLKQFWFNLLKWLLVILLSTYLMVQLQSDHQNFSKVTQVLQFQFEKHPYLIPFLLILSSLNWILEIKKWQILIRKFRSVSFGEASKQTLSSHSFSLVTPFKSGDYIFKTLFFERDKKLQILALNALGNLTQLGITLVMGMLGFGVLFLFYQNTFAFEMNTSVILGFVFVIILLTIILILYKPSFLGQHWTKIKILNRHNLYKILSFSLLRYLLFSHQFYFILLIFGVDLPYVLVMCLIFLTYVVSSILPVFTLFDFVIKGSAALFVFSKWGISESILFTTTTLMWLMNFVLPAMIGVWVILTLKREQFALKPKQK